LHQLADQQLKAAQRVGTQRKFAVLVARLCTRRSGRAREALRDDSWPAAASLTLVSGTSVRLRRRIQQLGLQRLLGASAARLQVQRPPAGVRESRHY
jgi:hypothetical protein